MTRTSLPAGVPAANRPKPQPDDAGFATPDMAVPHFAAAAARPSPSGEAFHTPRADYAAPSDYEDDVDEDSRRHAPFHTPALTRALILTTLLVAAGGLLGAIVIGRNDNRLPLCSDLPQWNQYNCRVE